MYLKLILFVIGIVKFALCVDLDSPSKIPLGTKYNGQVKFSIQKLFAITHGAKNELPEIGSGFYGGPFAFDVGPDTSIYVAYDSILYHFSKKGNLINSANISREVCDFKYHEDKIYAFKGESLAVYNGDSIKYVKSISLKKYGFTPKNIGKRSLFFDKFLFVRSFDEDCGTKVEYVYNITEDTFSKDLSKDSIKALPISNCEICVHSFIEQLFCHTSNSRYVGQSNRLLLYEYTCTPIINPKECNKKIWEYYILDKRLNAVYNVEIGEDIFDNLTFPTRQFIFINDTSVVLQCVLPERKTKKVQIQYLILTVHLEK